MTRDGGPASSDGDESARRTAFFRQTLSGFSDDTFDRPRRQHLPNRHRARHDRRMSRGETLARPRDACRHGSPGRMLGLVFGLLIVLLVVREVALLAGAREGTDARSLVEISDGSRALKERTPGALAWETGRVPTSPPPPFPVAVETATAREDQAEEAVAETPASREPANAVDETETAPAAANRTRGSAPASPLPAIGGGFHVASGHIVNARGEVTGPSAIPATATATATNVAFAPADPPLATRAGDANETAAAVSSDGLVSLDASCHAEDALDLDGPAVRWGMDFKVADAAACCAACKETEKCNSWVFCPSDECWAPDIWNHTRGECWLKTQEDPRNPAVNFRGDYPTAFREHHKTAPARVAWQAGVLL